MTPAAAVPSFLDPHAPALCKRGNKCFCGLWKVPGAPFCKRCWARVPEDLRSASRADHASAFPRICEYLAANPEAAEVPTVQADASPEKALIMVGLSEAQIDRVLARATLERKIVAVHAIFAHDRTAES